VIAAAVVDQAPFAAGPAPLLFLVYAAAAYGRSDRDQWLGLVFALVGAILTSADAGEARPARFAALETEEPAWFQLERQRQ
jgi:hypothetical protein